MIYAVNVNTLLQIDTEFVFVKLVKKKFKTVIGFLRRFILMRKMFYYSICLLFKVKNLKSLAQIDF